MNIEILENKSTELKVSFDTIDQGILNALKSEIWNEPDVEIAGFKITHSLVGNPIFSLITRKKSAKQVWNKAVDSLVKTSDEFAKLTSKI